MLPRHGIARESVALGFVFTWLVLAAFWFLLSGFTDAIHLGFGALSVTLVTFMSHRHVTRGTSVARVLQRAVRVFLYAPWLFWQILLANVEVIRCVLGFKPIAPQIVRIEAGVKSEFGLATLANSITLTPGTVTVDVETEGRLVIHALTQDAAEGVQSGDMDRRSQYVEGGA